MDLEVEKKNSPELQGRKPWLAIDVLPQSHFCAQLWTYEDQERNLWEYDGVSKKMRRILGLSSKTNEFEYTQIFQIYLKNTSFS